MAASQTATLKPLTLYGHWAGPNPFKVVILLKELELPYETQVIEFNQVKSKPYTDINPNGRLPSLIDPNTGITVWETGAIILYLIDQYDPAGKLSFQTPREKYECLQWLMFQVSGQGPYFGQAVWFARFHPERIPSATDRFVNEAIRVIGVLNTALQGKKWLVGEKCTYADLSFITWANLMKGLLLQLGKGEVLQENVNYSNWMEAMSGREVVKDVLAEISRERVAHGLPA